MFDANFLAPGSLARPVRALCGAVAGVLQAFFNRVTVRGELTGFSCTGNLFGQFLPGQTVTATLAGGTVDLTVSHPPV